MISLPFGEVDESIHLLKANIWDNNCETRAAGALFNNDFFADPSGFVLEIQADIVVSIEMCNHGLRAILGVFAPTHVIHHTFYTS